MSNAKKLVLALIIAASVLIVGPDRALACSCIPPGPPAEELAKSTAVFAGKVVALDVPTGPVISSADPVRVTFQVSTVWKGPVYNTLVVTTARGGASCGYEFKPGQEYLVYARGAETALAVSLCSRTRLLSAAGEDLATLGEAVAPTTESPDPSARGPSYPALVIVFGGIGIVLVIATIVAIKKRFFQWFNLSVLFLISLLTTACGSVTSASVADPTATSPVSPAGVPTPPPPPGTSMPVTPSSFYATQDAARQATIVARATASPFPTAGPATVQTGQPSIAATQRDGLSFQVRLPKDTYLAGEGGQAEVTLRNDDQEIIFVGGHGEHLGQPVLLDEQGHEPTAWPWPPMILTGGFFPYLRKLAPGEVVTETLALQVPPAEQAAGHTYVLWAETRFSRPQPDYPEGPDNLWLHLETGPIPLQVIPPEPERRLVADLQADREGWHLRVTDATGQVPPGPLWGFREVASSNSATAGPLQDSPDGTWSGAWNGHMREGDGQISTRIWIAAPGYVAAAVTQTVPGTGDAYRMFSAWEPPARQIFDSLEAAQTALDVPLYRLAPPPDGAMLNSVQVEIRTHAEQSWTDVYQSYRLPDDTWLELTQMVTTPAKQYAGARWGQARYAPEARPVTVGETAGYVVRQFGWWILDWKVGDVGFELRAPVMAFSLEELVTLATKVQLPEELR
ncbi:MAG: hypothetical protein SWK90_16300 [Chloroflexota bacterium]|nr:hypothetical protein [Chloroflexota bacterium]